MEQTYWIVRLPAVGGMELIATGYAPTQEQMAALLQTDVVERLRMFEMPPHFNRDEMTLCYLIDARSGERALPANFLGTCFYHTGCPIYGDLLLVRCGTDQNDEQVYGLTAEESETLRTWLLEQFPAYFAETGIPAANKNT